MTMRFNVAGAQQRQYAVGPVASNFQQSQMQQIQQMQMQQMQQYYLRQPAQHVANQPVQQVVRTRRATAAPEVHQRQAALMAEHKDRQRKVVVQRNVQAQRQQLQRQQRLQQQREEEELQAAQAAQQEGSARTPDKLPRAWQAEYELCPGNSDLGGGAFAEVFRVQHRESKEQFAVKVMHRPNFTLRGIERQIEQEIEAMRLAADLSRDLQEDLHILRLLDVVEECEYVYLLLELCEQGDLLRKLHFEPDQRISEREAVIMAKQLMIGLRTVHRLGFIHRDIKPDNLLCTGEGSLKIADFGWCCTTAEAPSSLAGTFQYMAPEVLSNVPQTVQADVWSAGVTLYQMMVGRSLLQTWLGPGATNLSEHDPHRATAIKQQWLVQEINQTCPPPCENRPIDISEMCWDFLRLLLHPDPTQRVSVEAALQHPWLEQAVFEEGRANAKAAAAAAQAEDKVSKEERMLCSPVNLKRKDARSPGSGVASKESVGNVPTPQKPREYDPSRNMAYTPPVSPEMTPERALWPHGEFRKPSEKENTNSPEVSPERKTRLQMSADRMSGKFASPKDTLMDRSAAMTRAPMAKIPSPQRGDSEMRGVSGGAPRRKTIASTMPASSDVQETGMRSPVSRASSSGRDLSSSARLLNRLQACDDETMYTLAESKATFGSEASDQSLRRSGRQDALSATARALEPMPELPEEGVVRYNGHSSAMVPSPNTDISCLDVENDALAATAPPGLVGTAGTPTIQVEQRRVSRTLKSPVKTLVETPTSARGSAEKSPATKTALSIALANAAAAAANVPPLPVSSNAGASTVAPVRKGNATAGGKVILNSTYNVGGCFSPPQRYAQGSPVKHMPMQTAQAPIITRTVVHLPASSTAAANTNAHVWNVPQVQQTPVRVNNTNTRRRASAPGTWVRP
eukprot:TRINITY_DN90663_c0_g1_i1.p1 TRINITY_DN90663_c0_g1~~TRINITY_DN90663_c0_g1_i1.p1  ORF type:complete len:912 (-),score=206.46 TRINITY_DN90663_c0_g1_i1:139-2874(-)